MLLLLLLHRNLLILDRCLLLHGNLNLFVLLEVGGLLVNCLPFGNAQLHSRIAGAAHRVLSGPVAGTAAGGAAVVAVGGAAAPAAALVAAICVG